LFPCRPSFARPRAAAALGCPRRYGFPSGACAQVYFRRADDSVCPDRNVSRLIEKPAVSSFLARHSKILSGRLPHLDVTLRRRVAHRDLSICCRSRPSTTRSQPSIILGTGRPIIPNPRDADHVRRSRPDTNGPCLPGCAALSCRHFLQLEPSPFPSRHRCSVVRLCKCQSRRPILRATTTAHATWQSLVG
jgi:hypothetical protein